MFYSVLSSLYPDVLPYPRVGFTLSYALLRSLTHTVYHTISYVSTFVLSNFTFFDPFSYDTITFRKLHL